MFGLSSTADGDITSMFSDAVRRVSSTIGVDLLPAQENLHEEENVEDDYEHEKERKFNVEKAKAETHSDAPFQRYKLKKMGRLVTRPVS